jgi:hypothetical protein
VLEHSPKTKRVRPDRLRNKSLPEDILGAHDGLVKRHRANGDVSSNDSNNCFITVGQNTAHIPALHKVYGKKCEAGLCSARFGKMRMAVCDRCEKSGHTTLDSGQHDLPAKSGPHDKKNWKRVQELTKHALKKGAKKR